MKKILITGAAGFIGFYLAKKLTEEGYLVTGLDNLNDYYDVDLKLGRLAELGIDQTWALGFNRVLFSSKYKDNFQFIRADMEDRKALADIFEEFNFDTVVNLAAQAGVRYSLENPCAYIRTNITGFFNLLECCKEHHIRHLVYASSSSVYGKNQKTPFSEEDSVDNPVSLYAATKKSNELMAHTYSHLYSVPTSGLRFFTVYGPWGRPDMAPMLFTKAILEGEPINVFNNGEMSRDFTFIDDIVQGILITLNNPPTSGNGNAPHQILNIGNGSPISLMRFIGILEENLGRKAKKNMMPMQDGDVPQTWADMSKLQKLGYRSKTPISQGVEKLIRWYRSYYLMKINCSFSE